jgi:hypothetical protein
MKKKETFIQIMHGFVSNSKNINPLMPRLTVFFMKDDIFAVTNKPKCYLF